MDACAFRHADSANDNISGSKGTTFDSGFKELSLYDAEQLQKNEYKHLFSRAIFLNKEDLAAADKSFAEALRKNNLRYPIMIVSYTNTTAVRSDVPNINGLHYIADNIDNALKQKAGLGLVAVEGEASAEVQDAAPADASVHQGDPVVGERVVKSELPCASKCLKWGPFSFRVTYGGQLSRDGSGNLKGENLICGLDLCFGRFQWQGEAEAKSATVRLDGDLHRKFLSASALVEGVKASSRIDGPGGLSFSADSRVEQGTSSVGYEGGQVNSAAAVKNAEAESKAALGGISASAGSHVEDAAARTSAGVSGVSADANAKGAAAKAGLAGPGGHSAELGASVDEAGAKAAASRAGLAAGTQAEGAGVKASAGDSKIGISVPSAGLNTKGPAIHVTPPRTTTPVHVTPHLRAPLP